MTAKAVLGEKTYEVVKWVTAIVLPAIGTLYFALAGAWGLPNAEQVLGTITAIATFLGVILGLSTYGYRTSDDRYVGDLVVDEGEGKTTYSLELNQDPDTLAGKGEAVFKIKGRP